jgi:LuxR family quorum sensing-dependent transcriptional regulator
MAGHRRILTSNWKAAVISGQVGATQGRGQFMGVFRGAGPVYACPMTTLTKLDNLALDIIQRIDDATSVGDAAQALLKGLRPMGVLSLMATDTDVAQKPAGARHAPVIAAATPKGWIGSEAAKFTDIHNPNNDHARIVQRPFLWKTANLPTKALYGAYWEAMGEFGGVDGLAVPVKEPGRSAGVSMAFGTTGWSREERRAMEFACYCFIDKVRELAPAPPDPPKLTARERDCLAFVAEGKTDWEISVIMNISQSTAHQHVENARRKLNAATRAHAVARFILLGLM